MPGSFEFFRSAQTGRRRDAEKGKVRDSDMNSACKSLVGFISHVLVLALMVQRKSLELKGGAVVVQVRTSLSNRLHRQDTREYSLYSVFVQWRYRHHLGRYALSVRCCDVDVHVFTQRRGILYYFIMEGEAAISTTVHF